MNKALIIVDVQNDFCPGGALPVKDGDKVVKPINSLISHALKNRWLIIATRDWHQKNTTHFSKFGGQWPVHCVQETRGAKFHFGLNIDHYKIFVFSKEVLNENR